MARIEKNLFVDYTAPNVFDSLKVIETMGELMLMVKEYGNKTAVIDGEASYSFAELDKRAGSFRAILRENGIKKGDAVGVLCPNSFDYIAVSMAIMSYGGVAVLLPVQLDDKTVFGCSMKFGMSALVYSPALKEKTGVAAKMNPALKLIASDTDTDDYEAIADIKPEDGAAVVFTGGTTGQSKGALLSHRALAQGTRNGCYGYGDPMDQRYFLVLPLTHIFGFVRNMLTALYTNSTLYICKDLKNMFREMPVYKPTLLVTVPALAEMALNVTKMMSPIVLGGELKTMICGAAVVYPYLAKEYEKLGVTLCAGYGMTETANLVSGNPETMTYPESVGYMYEGQDYKIVDGELLLKGANLFTEYYRDPEANAAAFDEEGYFKTGDLVRFDEDGRLYIVGRCKEIIVLSNGENISPAELETKFCELDCIQDALIYLDRSSGMEQLVLEVLPRTSVLKEKGIEDAEAYCTEQLWEVNKTLYDYQKINKIIIRKEDFARTPAMKIKRPNML